MNDLVYSSVLLNVSEALASLVREHIKGVEVLPQYPRENDKTPDRVISIYLYQTVEYSFMRNEPPLLTNGVHATTTDSLYLTLRYMVTPYSGWENELLWTNELLSLFREYPILEGDLLPEVLKASGNEQIKIIPTYPTTSELHQLWPMLFPRTNYRLSLFYDLRPVRIPLQPRKAEKRVKTIEVDYHFT